MAVRDAADPDASSQPESAPGAEPATGSGTVTAAGTGTGPVAAVLLPTRRPTGRPAPLPLRSRLSRAAQWRRQAQLEPIGTTLRRVARHPAVVGSASAATVLAARAGVEVLRSVMTRDRRPQDSGRLIVGRRVRVEYVEMWSRPR
jgi:hypothetical protein